MVSTGDRSQAKMVAIKTNYKIRSSLVLRSAFLFWFFCWFYRCFVVDFSVHFCWSRDPLKGWTMELSTANPAIAVCKRLLPKLWAITKRFGRLLRLLKLTRRTSVGNLFFSNSKFRIGEYYSSSKAKRVSNCLRFKLWKEEDWREQENNLQFVSSDWRDWW